MSTDSVNGSLLNMNYANGSLSDIVRQKASAYGSSNGLASMKEVSNTVKSLLSEVPNSGGKLTFKDVMEYRDELQKKFEASLKKELEAIGVDTDTEFTLSYDAASGKVTVDQNHPDKAKIDNYFDQNSEKREEFAKIVSYSNISNVAKNKLSPGQIRQQIQASAVEKWWSSRSGSSMANGNMMFGAGAPKFIGLNAVV